MQNVPKQFSESLAVVNEARLSAYEMKNNRWLFERLFKIQENGAFLFELSLFVLKILKFLYYGN